MRGLACLRVLGILLRCKALNAGIDASQPAALRLAKFCITIFTSQNNLFLMRSTAVVSHEVRHRQMRFIAISSGGVTSGQNSKTDRSQVYLDERGTLSDCIRRLLIGAGTVSYGDVMLSQERVSWMGV